MPECTRRLSLDYEALDHSCGILSVESSKCNWEHQWWRKVIFQCLNNWQTIGLFLEDFKMEEASNKLKRLLFHNYSNHFYIWLCMLKISNYITIMLKQQFDTYLVSISISLEDFKAYGSLCYSLLLFANGRWPPVSSRNLARAELSSYTSMEFTRGRPNCQIGWEIRSILSRGT